MKKIIALTIALILTLAALASCSGGTDEASKSENSTAPSSKTYTVGICNYVDDASLNQIVENIRKRLAAIGTEKNVTFEIRYDNCNGDSNVLSQIIANFIADDVDLMIGVATPVAMAMQAATEGKDIPVVFAAVSDPVSVQLVDSLETPGANITGTSDYLNTDAVMNLILAQNPDIKKVGMLYDIGQDSSTTPIASAKKFLESKGIEVIERTGTTVDEISLAAQALVSDGVEAVFTPTDNTVMTAELSIYETFTEAGVMHFTGADSFALNGAFVGYGVDYVQLGEATADMVAEILCDGKSAAEMPYQTFDNGIVTINTETAAALGFEGDKLDALKEAFKPYCTEIVEVTTAENFS